MGRPVVRRTGFDDIRSFDEMDEILAKTQRTKRIEAGLTQAEFAELIGLSTVIPPPNNGLQK